MVEGDGLIDDRVPGSGWTGSEPVALKTTIRAGSSVGQAGSRPPNHVGVALDALLEDLVDEDAGGESEAVGDLFFADLPGGRGAGRDDAAHLAEQSLPGRRVGPV